MNPTSMPLGRHTRFRTTDVGHAEAAAALVMSPHRLRVARPREFGARGHAVDIGCSKLAYVVYDTDVDLTAVAPMDYFTILLILRGSMHVLTEAGEARIDAGRAGVVSPGDLLRLRFAPGTVQIAAKLPREVVERAYARISAEPGPRLVFDVSAPHDSPCPHVLQLAVDTVDRCESGVLPPGVTGELERMVVTTLLLSQPHSGTRHMLRGGGTRGYRAAGLAAAAIEANLMAPLDVADLARTAGVSLRTLQDGFRSRYGEPLTTYHRNLRLDHAHRLLSEADAGGVTVAEIAIACGFLHLGRFAREYRLRQGVTPSATLHSPRDADNAARFG
ncbi:AraC family transcriptional regulator [Streptomyces cinereospinus]